MGAGLGVQQLQEVTGGDVAEHAALGRDDERGPAQRAGPDRGGCRDSSHRARRCANPWFRARAKVAARALLLPLAATSQRSVGRMMSALTVIRRPMLSSPSAAGVLAAAPATGRSPGSIPARGVGAAGQPPLLPAAARLVGQPVQQRCQAASAVARLPGLSGVNGGLVSRRHTASRPARVAGQSAAGGRAGKRARADSHPGAASCPAVGVRGHGAPVPNSTPRVSGR